VSAFGSHITCKYQLLLYTLIEYGYFNKCDNAEHACKETLIVWCTRNAKIKLWKLFLVKDSAKIIEYQVRVLIGNKVAFGNCNIHP
jgi:hypothetical protein